MKTLITLGLAAVGPAASPSHGAVKRHATHLRESYDFVVVGGGTTGLTIADRLTEAFPNKTVLVVEPGDVESAAGIFDPPQRVWGGAGVGRAGSSDFQSLPNPAVKGKRAAVSVGRTVGGSSAINGMFFDRGSRFDYDAWRELGSPEFDGSEHVWDWEGMLPYFQKGVTFTPPPADVAQEHGYTWDASAYGASTPIHASFPPFQWADHHIARKAWAENGARVSNECAGGDKEGICWVPISQHPVTAARSHAGIGHYAAVNATRPNYDLLVRHQVVRLVYPDGAAPSERHSRPPLVEVRAVAGAGGGGRLFNVSARAEVIVSAGALNTPAVLQRSGIGPAAFLRSAGFPVVLDLPGVGSNFQDHTGPEFSWNYSKPLDLYPLASEMRNATFFAEAVAAFAATPARGPYTLAMSQSALFLSLPNITANYTSITDRVRDMASDPSLSATSYLPAGPDYAADPSMAAGYARQLAVLSRLLANPRSPSLESPFATGTSMRAIMLHPLSRGTVRVDPASPSRLVLDYRAVSNPADLDLHVAHLRWLRAALRTPAMRALGAVEVAPGSGVGDDEDGEALLRGYVLDSMTLSFMHPCCTAAMMPRGKGGVVGPDLRVHGTGGGLRVADMSILPIIPGAHLSATAYAVGEKAADVIIRAWRS